MGKVNTLKKLRQYAREESRKHVGAITYEQSLLRLLKPKPKYLPWWLWTKIVKLVIRKDDKKEA